MLARTAKTHIRFGSFEYFHYNNQPENVKALADFCIDQYPAYFSSTPAAYEDFFRFFWIFVISNRNVTFSCKIANGFSVALWNDLMSL
ncbi:protein adenylyltransferase SelO family protein [Pseudomonadota bacterium]|nr:protein adenylyltransferase SelO family protein [Pseudomonadota bacterium]